MNKYYLYLSSKAVIDTFTNISIECRSVKNRTATIGMISENFLLITSKKLNRNLRCYGGLTSGSSDFPVTVELSIPDEKKEHFKGKIIKEQDGKYELEEGNLSGYSKEDIGFLIPGYIPFICISRFLFETDIDRLEIRQPSPTVWIPIPMLDIIGPDEEFSESIDCDKLIPVLNSIPADDKTKENVIRYNKNRAIVYAAVDGTQNWICGKYRMNIDPYICKYVGVTEDHILQKTGIPHDLLYSYSSADSLFETDCSIYKTINNIIIDILKRFNRLSTLDVDFFKIVKDTIIEDIRDRNLDSELIDDSNLQKDKTIKKISGYLEKIEGVIYRNNPIDPVLADIKEALPLTALIFLLKHPHNRSDFESTIETFTDEIESSVRRIARVYFAAVNGMSLLPGTGSKFRHDTALRIENELNPNCKWLETEYQEILGDKYSQLVSEYEINVEEIITVEDVHAFLCKYKEYILEKHLIDLKEIREIYGKSKDINFRNYLYYVTINKDIAFLPEFSKTGKVSISSEDFARIAKEISKTDEFFEDFIIPFEKFKASYSKIKDYWDNIYKKYAPKDPKPKMVEIQPKQEDTQPKQEEIQPKQEKIQPKQEDTQLKQEDTQLKQEDTQLKQEEIQPKQEEIQPKQEEIQPKQEEIQPKQEEIQPKQEEIQPKQEEIQPNPE